jgi:hypothetical protein
VRERIDRRGHRTCISSAFFGLSLLLLLSLTLSACGSKTQGDGTTTTFDGGSPTSGGGTGQSTSTSSGHSTSTTQADGPTTTPVTGFPDLHGTLVAPPPTPTTQPRQTGGAPVNCCVQAGDQILIKSGGQFWPQSLDTAPVQITWTNLSGVAVTVSIMGTPVASPVIKPGWRWVWGWYAGGTFSYKSSLGTHGVINFQPTTPVTLPSSSSTTS